MSTLAIAKHTPDPDVTIQRKDRIRRSKNGLICFPTIALREKTGRTRGLSTFKSTSSRNLSSLEKQDVRTSTRPSADVKSGDVQTTIVYKKCASSASLFWPRRFAFSGRAAPQNLTRRGIRSLLPQGSTRCAIRHALAHLIPPR